MTRLFAIVLVVHGLIHLIGVAKAFRFAEFPQLTQPISPLFGVLWLTASLLFLATARSLFAWPRWCWALGAISVGVSMLAISQSWTDARPGALANLVILAGVVFGFRVHGPFRESPLTTGRSEPRSPTPDTPSAPNSSSTTPARSRMSRPTTAVNPQPTEGR